MEYLQTAKSVNELKGLKDKYKTILLNNGNEKSLASLFSIKRGQNGGMAIESFTVDGKSKNSLSMNLKKTTKRQKKLKKSGCKGLFCGSCGATKFFKENSRERGACVENCDSRAYGFAENKHTKWNEKEPTQEEMDTLNKKYCGRKQY